MEHRLAPLKCRFPLQCCLQGRQMAGEDMGGQFVFLGISPDPVQVKCDVTSCYFVSLPIAGKLPKKLLKNTATSQNPSATLTDQGYANIPASLKQILPFCPFQSREDCHRAIQPVV